MLLHPRDWTETYVNERLRRICEANPANVNPWDGVSGEAVYADGKGQHCIVGAMIAEHEAAYPEIADVDWRSDRSTARNTLASIGARDIDAQRAARLWQSEADGEEGFAPTWDAVAATMAAKASSC